MIGIFIAIILALGVGGTVVVSDSARPGDALFGIDQAVEKVRISLANDETKNELRIRFTEERVSEIESLVQDDVSAEDSEDQILTAEEQENLSIGVEAALNLLAGLEEQEEQNPRIDEITSRLNILLTNLPADARIEVSNDKLEIKFEGEERVKVESKDGESKIEIRTDEGRIKVEIKDGFLEIKTKLDDEFPEEMEGLEEAEAKIFPDKTIVEVEFNDEKTTFTMGAADRDAIIAGIIAKFPGLTSAEVNAVLEIETEDDDEEDEDDDSDDGEDQDEDEDEDSEDEDNSGSNSGSGNR